MICVEREGFRTEGWAEDNGVWRFLGGNKVCHHFIDCGWPCWGEKGGEEGGEGELEGKGRDVKFWTEGREEEEEGVGSVGWGGVRKNGRKRRGGEVRDGGR